MLTSSSFEAFNRFEAENGIPKDFIRTINATNPDDNVIALFESSALDLDGFDEAFLAETTAAGHPIPGKTVISSPETCGPRWWRPRLLVKPATRTFRY